MVRSHTLGPIFIFPWDSVCVVFFERWYNTMRWDVDLIVGTLSVWVLCVNVCMVLEWADDD